MRAAITGILLALVLAIPACDDGGGGAPPAQDPTPDFGPTAAYNRRLLFLGPGGDIAAVFDFAALSDSIGIRRGARARLGDGNGWRALLDDGWEMESMREPWRLVPHGPLKMTVGEAGDLSALVHRDTVPTRLELGQVLAEHSPDVGTQLVLRTGRLVRADQSLAGIVLDVQLGRAVSSAQAVRETAPEGRGGAGAGQGAGSPATPIALPGAEALLLDGQGYLAALATATGGSLAWIRSGDRSDVRPGARLEPTAWSAAEDDSIQVPTAWRIVSASGLLTGELTVRTVDRNRLQGADRLEALSYALVTGWIEDRNARRDVYGLVRHVR